jgi:hypothetical protein
VFVNETQNGEHIDDITGFIGHILHDGNSMRPCQVLFSIAQMLNFESYIQMQDVITRKYLKTQFFSFISDRKN